MKRSIGFTIIILLLFQNLGIGQGGRQERIESLRVAFMTNELELSPKESQKFWPIYNSMQKELRVIRSEMRKNRIGASTKSNKELERMMLREFDLKENQIAVERKYFLKFKKILPIQKIAKIKSAENAFKKELLRRRKNRRK